MDRELVITTGARLHFGLLSHNRRSGRQFGGAGLMVDSPGFQIAARVANEDTVIGPGEFVERARQFLETYRSRCPSGKQPPPCRLEIRNVIAPHIGLGSGTQLGLAVSQSLALLAGGGTPDAATLAGRVARGARSALGIHGFARGGFLVDGGKAESDSIGVLAARVEFPPEWCFVLVCPHEASGLSGAAEREAFHQLAAMPQRTTDRLYRIVLMALLPAVVEADFPACGEALFELNSTVGDYFGPVQGGTYANPQMGQLVEHLRRQGLRGVGQSSWGPTVFILCENREVADQLVDDLSADARWNRCQFRVAAPMNNGAVIHHL